MKILFTVFLIGVVGTAFGGENPSTLNLHSGINEIPIVLHNQSLRSITNLDIDTGSGAPDWVTVITGSVK